MDIYSATLLLFLVVDPFGNIPAFLSILRRAPLERQRSIIIREMVIALVVLVFFLFAGRYILEFLRISSAALSVAGGVILFLIALRMVFPGGDLLKDGAAEEEPFIVPLAIPLIAGPSAMTMVMLLMAARPGLWAHWLGAVVLAWAGSCLILMNAGRINAVLGRRTLAAMERLMGLILTTLSVQMLMDGIGQVYLDGPAGWMQLLIRPGIIFGENDGFLCFLG